MLKILLLTCVSFTSVLCSRAQSDTAVEIFRSYSPDRVKKNLFYLASDSLEGRETGMPGQRKAAEYIAMELLDAGLLPGGDSGTFLQAFKAKKDKKELHSENVIGYIPGSDLSEQVVIVSAHYDHLGIKEGLICNGADDNASGTSAVMELAHMFGEGFKKGYKPRRTILFILMSGEEKGLLGSKHYVGDPKFPLKNCVADLNIDMIGRTDSIHVSDSNYVYLIGSDMMSTDLHRISEEANKKCCGMALDYTYNSTTDKNRYYYRSDHYNFARNGIPVIFYFNGVHADYHKPSDTADKINFNLLGKRTRLVFFTLYELSYRNERPRVDR